MQDFRHPEQSSKMIVRMAKDIIENLGICPLHFLYFTLSLLGSNIVVIYFFHLTVVIIRIVHCTSLYLL